MSTFPMKNLTVNGSVGEECNVLRCPYLISREVYIAFVTMYIVVITVGFTLNATICYIYVKGFVKQSACNLTLANLSISDITSDLFALPYLFLDYTYLDVSEKGGQALCGISQAGFIVGVAVSIMTLAFISTSRFCLINYPLQFTWIHSKKTVRMFVLCAWVVAIGGLMPLFISLYHDKLTNICRREWPPHFNGELYSTVMFVLGFLIPILIMFVTLGWSSKTLIRTPLAVRRQSIAFKERRKIMTLFASLIVVFVIFWGPYFVFWVLSRVMSRFSETVSGEYTRKKWVRVVILIALCNTIADPLVYVVTNRDFRKGFFMAIMRRRLRAATETYSSSLPPATVASMLRKRQKKRKEIELLAYAERRQSPPNSSGSSSP